MENEYQRAGSAFRVVEQHLKNEYHAYGEKPVFITPEEKKKKIKTLF